MDRVTLIKGALRVASIVFLTSIGCGPALKSGDLGILYLLMNDRGLGTNTGTGTGTSTGTVPPEVASTNPADGSVNIATSTKITVTFTKSMDGISITANISDTQCLGSIQVTCTNFTTCVRMQPQGVAQASAYTVTPLAPLPSGVVCKIRVTTDARDADNNPLPAVFTTPTGFTTDAL